MADDPVRRIVAFDFDGTLVGEDTFLTFARHALGLRRLAAGIIKSLPDLLRWKLGLTDGGHAKERLFAALYKGISKESLTRAAMTFRPHYRPEVLRQATEAIARGETVYIISASLDLWLTEQARRIGAKLCCTKAETAADGTLTGRFSTPNCSGTEKVRRLLAEEPDRTTYHLTAYGDSDGDTPLLAMADTQIRLR